MEWHEYEAKGDDFVDMVEWGKDHWSTFAYLETCAVDNGGIVDNEKMRCNARLHRELANGMDAKTCHTCLKSREVGNHDDWSCLEDMVAAGLLTAEWCERTTTRVFGHCQARVTLTQRGWQVASLLRQHVANGGNYRDFDPAEYDCMHSTCQGCEAQLAAEKACPLSREG